MVARAMTCASTQVSAQVQQARTRAQTLEEQVRAHEEQHEADSTRHAADLAAKHQQLSDMQVSHVSYTSLDRV